MDDATSRLDRGCPAAVRPANVPKHLNSQLTNVHSQHQSAQLGYQPAMPALHKLHVPVLSTACTSYRASTSHNSLGHLHELQSTHDATTQRTTCVWQRRPSPAHSSCSRLTSCTCSDPSSVTCTTSHTMHTKTRPARSMNQPPCSLTLTCTLQLQPPEQLYVGIPSQPLAYHTQQTLACTTAR